MVDKAYPEAVQAVGISAAAPPIFPVMPAMKNIVELLLNLRQILVVPRGCA
jgi:hypothetical protein